jgi:hypothetical protein
MGRLAVQVTTPTSLASSGGHGSQPRSACCSRHAEEGAGAAVPTTEGQAAWRDELRSLRFTETTAETRRWCGWWQRGGLQHAANCAG